MSVNSGFPQSNSDNQRSPSFSSNTNPTRSLEDLCRLEHSLRSQKSKDITALFLVSTSQGISFVKKRSIKGVWIAFKENVRKLFGLPRSLLDINSSIRKIDSACEIVLAQKEPFFKGLKESNSDKALCATELRDKIERLRSELQKLQLYVNNKRDKMDDTKSEDPIQKLQKRVEEDTNKNLGLLEGTKPRTIIASHQEEVNMRGLEEATNKNPISPEEAQYKASMASHSEDINIKDYFTSFVDYLQDKDSDWQHQCPQLRSITENSSLEVEKCEEQLQEIRKKFDEKKIKNYLLFSSSGNMLYEIQRSKKGEYTFRIYYPNGMALGRETPSNFHNKSVPFYGVTAIKKEFLFSAPFFRALALLGSEQDPTPSAIGNKPKTIDLVESFMTTILPMLGGKKEAIPDSIHKEIHANEPLGYSTFKAFLSSFYPADEYQNIKLCFQSHLISQLLNSASSIDSDLLRSIKIEYAYTLKRLSKESYSDQFISKAHALLEKQEEIEMSMSPNIAPFQNRAKLSSSLVSELVRFNPKTEDMKEIQASSENKVRELSFNTYKQLMEKVEGVPRFGEAHFWPEFLSCLQDLTSVEGSFKGKSLLFLSLEALVQKIPSNISWDEVVFQDSSNAIKIISNVFSAIDQEFNFYSTSCNSDSTLLYFCLTRFFERAANLWLQESGKSEKENISFFDPFHQFEFLSKMHPVDPYWNSVLSDMNESIKNGKVNPCCNLRNKEYEKNSLKEKSLPKELFFLMKDWWESEPNREQRERVEKSILSDKKACEERYRKKKEKLNKNSREKESKELSQIGLCKSRLDSDWPFAVMFPTDIESKPDGISSQEYALMTFLFAPPVAEENLDSAIEDDLDDVTEDDLDDVTGDDLDDVTRDNLDGATEGDLNSSFLEKKGFQKDLFPNELRLVLDHLVKMAFFGMSCQFGYNGLDTSSFHYTEGKKDIHIYGDQRSNCDSIYYFGDHKSYSSKMNVQNKGVAHLYEKYYMSKRREEFTPADQQLHESTLHSIVQYHDGKISNKELLLEKKATEEVAAIWATKGMQLSSLILYFTKRPELLYEPVWLNLFQITLFEPGLLAAALKEDKEGLFFLSLANFLNSNIIKSEKMGNIGHAAQMSWIGAQVQAYIAEAGLEKPLFKEHAILPDGIWKRLFQKSCEQEHASDRLIVYESLLASLKDVDQIDIESEEAFFVETALSALLMESDTIPDAQAVIARRTARDIATRKLLLWVESFEDKEKMANLFVEKGAVYLKKLFPNLEIKAAYYDKETFFLQNAQGEVVAKFSFIPEIYFTFSRESESINCDKTFSSELLERLDLKWHGFLNQYSSFTWTKSNQILYVQHTESKMLFKVDLSDNKKTYCHIPSETGDDIWAEYCDSYPNTLDALPSIIASNYHLFSKDNQFYFYNKETYTCEYRSILRADGNLEIISTPEADSQYRFVTAIKSFASSFEETDNMIGLSDESGRLGVIQLPQFGLSFVKEEAQSIERWVLENDPEWAIAEEQFSDHFAQKNSFLFLEKKNGSGEKKILIPTLETSSKKSGREYVEVELKMGSNQLEPRTIEAQMYLIRAYQLENNIQKAEELAFHYTLSLTSRPYTARERAIIKEIVSSNSFLSARLNFYMLSLLETNKASFPEESALLGKEELDLNSKIQIVITYLSTLKKNIPIEKHQELQLLKCIIEDPQFKEKVELHTQQQITYRYEELSASSKKSKPFSFSSLIAPIVENVAYLNSFSFLLHKNESPSKAFEAKPSKSDHIDYKNARKKGTFPFDYLTVEYERFSEFIPLIYKECSRTIVVGSIEKNELANMLLHMIFFSSDKNSSADAAVCFAKLMKWHIKVPHLISAFRQSYVKDRSSHQKESKNLFEKVSNYFLDLPLLISNREVKTNFEEMYSKLGNYIEKREKSPLIKEEKSAQICSNKTIGALRSKYIREKYESMKSDLEIAQTKNRSIDQFCIREIDGKTIYEEALELNLEEQEEILTNLSETIEKSVHGALLSNPIWHSEVILGHKKLPSITDLVVAVCRPDPKKELSRLYKEFNEEAQNILIKKVEEYLQQKRYVQTIGRIKNVLSKEMSETDIKAFVSLLQDEQEAYRRKGKTENIILALETSLNICIRKDQVDKIEKIISGGDAAYQIIMGFGKTKVLLPLIAPSIIGSQELSTITVPPQLYSMALDSLKETLGESFAKTIYAFQYNREKAKNLLYIKTVIEDLKKARQNGSIIMQTPRTKQSILASLYEAFFDTTVTDRSEKIASISSIIKESLTSEVSQIDEIETVLDPDISFKYAIGDKKSISQKKGLFISKMLFQFATHPEVRGAVSIDFIDVLNAKRDPGYKKGEPLSNSQIETVIRPLLSTIAEDLLIDSIPAFQSAPSEAKKYLNLFLLQKLNSEEDQKSYEKWITKAKISKEEESLIEAAMSSIMQMSTASLLKECGSHYGPDPDPRSTIAKPYSAPNAPKITVYSGEEEQMIYSVQQLFYYGIPRKFAQEMLETLYSNIRKSFLGSPHQYKEGVFYKKLESIFGDQLLNIDDILSSSISSEAIDLFQERVFQNEEFLFEYIENYIIPKTRKYEKNIVITPFAVTSLSKKTIGYTGTLHSGILPKKMETHFEPGTDGTTILALQNKLETGKGSISTYSDTNSPLLDQIIEKIVATKENRVFIDSGGWLKKRKVESFSEELLKRFAAADSPIKGIVFHNSKDQLVVLEEFEPNQFRTVPIDESRYSTKDGSLYTIIAQKYETGTDIPQQSSASAIMTIRKNMSMKSLLQGVSRMRGLLKDQSISFAMDLEVEKHIEEELKDQLSQSSSKLGLEEKKRASVDVAGESSGKNRMDDLLQYCLINQSKDEMRRNWSAGVAQMRESIETPFIAILTDEQISIEKRSKLFLALQGLVVKDNALGSNRTFHSLQSSEKLRDELVDHFFVFAETMYKMFPNHPTMAHFIGNIKEKLKGCITLEEVCESQMVGSNIENEVEIEEELELEEETQIEEPIQKRTLSPQSRKKLPDSIDLLCDNLFAHNSYKSIKEVVNKASWAKEIKDVENIYVSPNLKLTGDYKRTAPYIFIVEDSKHNSKYFICDNEDALSIKKSIGSSQSKKGYKAMLVSDIGEMLTRNSPQNELKDEDQKILALIKIYTGALCFNGAESSYIDKTVKEKNELLSFIFESLQNDVDARKMFQNSEISALLKK